eukprot:29981_1
MAALFALDVLIGRFQKDSVCYVNDPIENWDEMVSVLEDNDVNVDTHSLGKAFVQCKYNKQQLIDNLCDILFCQNHDNVLSIIFSKYMNITNQQELQRIYEIIMYCFLKRQDIDICNFIKILKHVASVVKPTINVNEIEKIAEQQKLSGSIFIKGKTEFKNSTKFAKLFEKTKDYNKKQWAEIYREIYKKWKPLKSTKIHTEQKESNVDLEAKKKMQIVYSFGIKYWYNKWKKKFAENEEEEKAVFIEPYFGNFKDEVINSTGKILLDVERWNLEMKIAE